MPYQNPLHIIAEKLRDEPIQPAMLKAWRKELMLQFDLQGTTTIKIKGVEYDKQGVLEAFAGMEQDFELHRKIYRRPLLLNFLEKGDLELFRLRENYAFLKEPGEANLSEFRSVFTPAFSKAYRKNLESSDKASVRFTQLLTEFVKQVDPINSYTYYAESFARLHSELKTLKPHCYEPKKSKNSLKTEVLSPLFNNRTRLKFENLPPDFYPLKNRLSIQAYEIFYQVFKEPGVKIMSYDKASLELLLACARMGLFTQRKTENEPYLTAKIKELEEAVAEKNKHPVVRYGQPLAIGCFLYVIIFVLVWLLSGGKNASKSRSYQPPKGSFLIGSLVNTEYWEENMLGWYETEHLARGYRARQVLFFSKKYRGEEIWITESISPPHNSCMSKRKFSWRIFKDGNSQLPELQLTYDYVENSDCTHPERLQSLAQTSLGKERHRVEVNVVFNKSNDFKWNNETYTEFLPKPEFRSRFTEAKGILTEKIQRMEIYFFLKNQTVFGDKNIQQFYEIRADRAYKRIFYAHKQFPTAKAIGELKIQESQWYLDFKVTEQDKPDSKLLFSWERVPHLNEKGEIVSAAFDFYQSKEKEIIPVAK